MKSSTWCQISYAHKIATFLPQYPPEKMAWRRPKTNSEGGRNPFPQTPRLPSALSQRRVQRDAIKKEIMVLDFRRKKFEL